MNHLTDRQLVELLYGDFTAEGENFDASERVQSPLRSHLSVCGECSARLDELGQLAGCLDQYHVPNRKLEIDVESLAGPDSKRQVLLSNQAPVSSISGSNRWVTAVIAATLLILIANIGFSLGVFYQWSSAPGSLEKQEVVDLVDRFDRRFNRRIEQLESSVERISEIDATFNSRVDRIVKQNSEFSQSSATLAEIKTFLAHLSVGQQQLSEELQLLAVNADSEIASARQEIDRLNQIAELILRSGEYFSGE